MLLDIILSALIAVLVTFFIPASIFILSMIAIEKAKQFQND